LHIKKVAIMSSEPFDWALLKSFLAVLDAGSLLGAARKLGAQQPTLSRHIAQLEAQLKVPLFERTGRGVTPTAAALTIAEAARGMETSAATLARALAAQRETTTGTVRVSTSQVAASYLLAPMLARFQQEEPGIQIELVVTNSLSNLLRREADIAVRMIRPVQSSLIAKKLADISIIACAHQQYLKRAGTPKLPKDILKHRLIGYDRDDTILRGFARLRVPVTREHFVLRTDDHIAYGQLIASGAGIGFAAPYNLRYWPGVIPLLPTLKIPSLPCWLAVHREIRSNILVRRVYDYLAASIPAELTSNE
jgi:DNA-binding transcriptional LysR family regulator